MPDTTTPTPPTTRADLIARVEAELRQSLPAAVTAEDIHYAARRLVDITRTDLIPPSEVVPSGYEIRQDVELWKWRYREGVWSVGSPTREEALAAARKDAAVWGG